MRSARRRMLLATAVIGLVGLAVLTHRLRAPWESWQPDPITLPSPNGFDAILAAADTAWALPADQQGDKQTAAARAESVERNREAVEMLRRALPLPFVDPQAASFGSSIVLGPKVRSLMHALDARARWHLDRGEAAEAARCQLDLAELGHRLAQGGTLSGFLLGGSSEAIGRRTAPETVSALSGLEAMTALRRLEPLVAARVDLPSVVRSNGQSELGAVAPLLRKVSGWGITSMAGPTEGDHLYFAARSLASGGKRGMWRGYRRYLDDCCRTASAPPGLRSWPDPKRYGWFVGEISALHWDKPAFKSDCYQLGSNLWLTALALRAYQADHGCFPETLDALAPGYLPAVPQDVFAQAPLRYRLGDGKPVLYSVGPDRVDNDAAPIATDKAKPASWDQDAKGDVVWGVTRI